MANEARRVAHRGHGIRGTHRGYVRIRIASTQSSRAGREIMGGRVDLPSEVSGMSTPRESLTTRIWLSKELQCFMSRATEKRPRNF